MLDLSGSNDFIIDLIKKDEPFLIIRLGCEAMSAHHYQLDISLNKISIEEINMLQKNAGIYWEKDALLVEYCKKYNEAVKNSKALAYIQNAHWMEDTQQYYIKKYELSCLYSRILEPFYCSLDGIKPWTHHLLGKKILIINSFTNTMKDQVKKGFHIFNDLKKRIFLSGQEVKFYKTFNTVAGNRIHKNWLETFNIMCDDIKKIDFDIALLGCGGYGLPLSDFIYTKMKKSAVYVGGGIQLLFGIMGKRWDGNEMWKKIIDESDSKFVRPSKDEQIKNSNIVENSCYW